MSELEKLVQDVVEDMFDNLGYKIGPELSEDLYKAFQQAGYSDLADAWFDWCSSDVEGWPRG